MNIVELARFSASCNSISLPSGPVLELPGGALGVFNQGRVFAHGKWIIAVGVAPNLFLVLGSSARRHVPPALREQLVGYLTACGAEVVRMRIRFALSWHKRGELSRTIVYWVTEFVSLLSVSLKPHLGARRPQLALPLGVLACQAQYEWSLVFRILAAIEEEHSRSLHQFQSLLWDISHRWEIQWSLILRDAERRHDVSRDERSEIEHCDRTWMAIYRRYLEPRGYELLPATVARLL